MPYQLKKNEESFEIVDGPDAGLKFERGRIYDETPSGYRRRFEKIKAPATEPGEDISEKE